jgi:hypothetical protein
VSSPAENWTWWKWWGLEPAADWAILAVIYNWPAAIWELLLYVGLKCLIIFADSSGFSIYGEAMLIFPFNYDSPSGVNVYRKSVILICFYGCCYDCFFIYFKLLRLMLHDDLLCYIMKAVLLILSCGDKAPENSRFGLMLAPLVCLGLSSSRVTSSSISRGVLIKV